MQQTVSSHPVAYMVRVPQQSWKGMLGNLRRLYPPYPYVV